MENVRTVFTRYRPYLLIPKVINVQTISDILSNSPYHTPVYPLAVRTESSLLWEQIKWEFSPRVGAFAGKYRPGFDGSPPRFKLVEIVPRETKATSGP